MTSHPEYRRVVGQIKGASNFFISGTTVLHGQPHPVWHSAAPVARLNSVITRVRHPLPPAALGAPLHGVRMAPSQTDPLMAEQSDCSTTECASASQTVLRHSVPQLVRLIPYWQNSQTVLPHSVRQLVRLIPDMMAQSDCSDTTPRGA